MKIDVLCNDGSPLGVSVDTIYGEEKQPGVGGAELALLTMCEWWSKEYDVTLYNNPRRQSETFTQRHIHEFNPQAKRDVLIIFRSPNPQTGISNGKKVWWSCDQRTVGDFRSFSKTVDQIVTISKFHAEYFERTYGIIDTTTIDLPVRVQDFDVIDAQKKINQFIFTSIPDRGLGVLAYLWDKIKVRIEDASLIITSDYRLWGSSNPNNQKHKNAFRGHKDVQFKGAVSRNEYCRLLLESECLTYPCTYEELFCISVAEAQYAGVVPITTGIGSLPTTILIQTLSRAANFDPDFTQEFIETLVDTVSDRNELRNLQKSLSVLAKGRFHPTVIMDQWDEKVFNK